MRKYGPNTSQIPVCAEVRAELANIRDRWKIPVMLGDGKEAPRPDRVNFSVHMLLELMCAYVLENPPNMNWMKDFEFKTRGPGRPRTRKLHLDAFPPVSEDQPSDNEEQGEIEGIPQFKHNPGPSPDPGSLYPRR